MLGQLIAGIKIQTVHIEAAFSRSLSENLLMSIISLSITINDQSISLQCFDYVGYRQETRRAYDLLQPPSPGWRTPVNVSGWDSRVCRPSSPTWLLQ